MVNDQRLREYPPARFREAALAVVTANGRVASWEAPVLVATALGLHYRDFESNWQYQVNPLDARVRTALNGLAATGLIRKVPRGECQPGGGYDYKHALYYMLERFAADEKKAADYAASVADIAQRWAHVTRRLGGLGILMDKEKVGLSIWEGTILPALEAQLRQKE